MNDNFSEEINQTLF